MNRRNFLKELMGGSIGVAIASALPDKVLAREMGLRDVRIEADVDRHGVSVVKMKIGDEDFQEVKSLVAVFRYAPDGGVLNVKIDRNDSSIVYGVGPVHNSQ